jgi:hypothetical protein
MRKRNTPIRMIAVRPVQARRRMVLAIAERFGFGPKAHLARQDAPEPSLARPDRDLECLDLDLDQRVRKIGEW